MKNPITFWLKRIILLALIIVQVGNLYAADRVLAEIEITTPESAQGQEFVNSWRVLDEVGESGLAGRLDDIEVINTHLKNNPNKTPENLIDEINEAGGFNSWRLAGGGAGFIAKSGTELKAYLNGIQDIPLGTLYSKSLYRYKTTGGSYSVTNINPNMNPLENRFKTGLYASTSKDGNLIEVNAYGGTVGKTQYEISDVRLENVLDLTSETVIKKLGTSFDQMRLSGVSNKYEYTHVVAEWAKSKGYSGVKFKGAHGSQSGYDNIIIFEQTTVNNSIINSTITPVSW